MAIRCNICSKDIDEKGVEDHVATQGHTAEKEKLSRKDGKGSDLSVVKVWMSSL